MTIGERIKNRREELGLTQDELAKKCGYKSRSSINKIELSRELPLKKVNIMADALDCSPTYLMGWKDAPLEEPKPEPSDDKIAKAIELYSRYENLPPERQQEFQDYLTFLQSKSAPPQ